MQLTDLLVEAKQSSRLAANFQKKIFAAFVPGYQYILAF